MKTLLKRIGHDEYKLGDPSDPENKPWIDVSGDKECVALARSRGVYGTPSASAFGGSVAIESNIAPPPDDEVIQIHNPDPEPEPEKPVFFEPPKKRQPKAKKPEDPLLITLREIGLIVKKSGDLQKTHVRIMRSFVVAHVDTLTIGLPFGYGFDTLVQYQQLLDAKRRSGDEFAATMLDDGSVSVVAGELTMRVPAGNPQHWYMPQPDTQVGVTNDSLRTALLAATAFATDKLARPEIAGLQLEANTCVGTNGHGLVQAWHGWDMPPNQRIPVLFAKVLAKINRPIVGFGFSDVSFTVWFADGGFIRTAKHQPEYCNWSPVFANEPQNVEQIALPESFFKAIDAIRPFCNNDCVYFVDGNVCSRREGDNNSTYRISSLPYAGFDIKYLKAAKPFMGKVKFVDNRVFFYGDNVRGVLMGLDMKKADTVAEVQGQGYTDPESGEHFSDWDDYDDDIPF